MRYKIHKASFEGAHAKGWKETCQPESVLTGRVNVYIFNFMVAVDNRVKLCG